MSCYIHLLSKGCINSVSLAPCTVKGPQMHHICSSSCMHLFAKEVTKGILREPAAEINPTALHTLSRRPQTGHSDSVHENTPFKASKFGRICTKSCRRVHACTAEAMTRPGVTREFFPG